MAISVTDVQGTKLYLVATNVATSTPAEIATAISGGKQIGCLQSVGETTMSRSVQEYTCISSDESTKSSGSISLGNKVISTLFNSQDTAGQQDLIDMWNNNTRRKLITELNDNAGISPTYIIHEGFISSVSIPTEKDGAVLYDVTLEISSLPEMYLAT